MSTPGTAPMRSSTGRGCTFTPPTLITSEDRILFRGRSSEVINVGGVKVHPLPVEDRIGAVPGVDMARVFGRPNAMTGAIVAVEVVAAPGADTDQIAAQIRAACADLPAAA